MYELELLDEGFLYDELEEEGFLYELEGRFDELEGLLDELPEDLYWTTSCFRSLQWSTHNRRYWMTPQKLSTKMKRLTYVTYVNDVMPVTNVTWNWVTFIRIMVLRLRKILVKLLLNVMWSFIVQLFLLTPSFYYKNLLQAIQ